MKIKSVFIIAFLIGSAHLLCAQGECDPVVKAGIYSDMDYHTVNQTLYGNLPDDDLYLDLNSDGSNDIMLTAEYSNFGMGFNSRTYVQLQHNKIEIMTDTLQSNCLAFGDSISKCSYWNGNEQDYYELGGIYMEPAYIVSGNWLSSQGYLGFRVFSGADTLYGWLQMYSIITETSSMLEVYDWAIMPGDVHVPGTKEIAEIKIFPNPVSDMVYIIAPDIMNEIRIYDFSGRTVYENITGDHTATITFSGFGPGIYYITIKNKDGVHSEKIVKR